VISVLMLLLGAVLAVGGAIGGLAGGFFGLSQASPLVTLLVWDGIVAVFLFFWTAGLISELQRSDLIDLSRLMHLPVSLRDVFLLNYIASHLSLSLAFCCRRRWPCRRHAAQARAGDVPALPAGSRFLLHDYGVTYCLRGWLAALMVNKRRRRAIIVGVTMVFVLLMQLPNLLMNVWGGRHVRPSQTAPGAYTGERLAAMLDLPHRCVPPLWLPREPNRSPKGMCGRRCGAPSE